LRASVSTVLLGGTSPNFLMTYKRTLLTEQERPEEEGCARAYVPVFTKP